MRRPIATVLLLVLLSTGTGIASKKKNQFAMTKIPDQWVELSRIANVRAEQHCDNWAWAAGMEIMLRRQNIVDLDQRYWILKLNGGLPCLPTIGAFESVKKQMDGEYVLSPSQKVNLEIHYVEHLPETTDELVKPLALGRPYLLWWKNHPYVVIGATWDDFIYQTGQKLSEIKTLKMIDTSEVGEARTVIFNRETDSTADLGAMFDIVVTDATFDPWKPPYNPAMK